MHTQIVLCPGINDGEHLGRTVTDLAGLFPAVSSIAVVPVGITGHQKWVVPAPDVHAVRIPRGIERRAGIRQTF